MHIDKERIQIAILDQEKRDMIEIILNNHLNIIKEKGMENYHNLLYSILFIAEAYECVEEKETLNNLLFSYVNEMKSHLDRERIYNTASLFGGWSELGYVFEIVNKKTGLYENFAKSIRRIVVMMCERYLKGIENRLQAHSVLMSDYDLIYGVTGIISYLLLSPDEESINIIKKFNGYLVRLLTGKSKDKDGILLPNWHVLDHGPYAEVFPNGLLNLSLSHGIAGPIGILSKTLMRGIEVPNQRDAIQETLNVIMQYSYKSNNGVNYYVTRIQRDDFIEQNIKNNGKTRMSWCYGSGSILRSIEMAGNALGNIKLAEDVREEIIGIGELDSKEYLLDSPTICHGYAGILILLQQLRREKPNKRLDLAVNKFVDHLISLYKPESLYGFENIEHNNITKKSYSTEDLTVISGSTGVVLSLLGVIKETEFEGIFLMK